LLALGEEDSLAPCVHRIETRFFGTRAVTHAMAPQARQHRLEAFLAAYPEADPQLIVKALHQLYLICLHELRDPVAAEGWLKKLEAMPEGADKVRVERLLQVTADRALHDDGMLEQLSALEQALAKKPYDNGYVPVLEPQRLKLLVAQANLLNGQYAAVLPLVKEFSEDVRVRTLPVRLLYALLADEKDLAYQLFVKHEKAMIAGDRKMIDDFLYPLYLPVRENEKRIIAATALAADHPTTAVKLLLEESKKPRRSMHFDHAFALLAELYQRQGSYAEAQSVWATLRRVFPHSVWTR